ncbi:hypothetical protein BJX65DRAFT_306592 [Aspergillus insuetus]
MSLCICTHASHVLPNLGEYAESIYAFRDEDPKELEPNGLIPLTGQAHGQQVVMVLSVAVMQSNCSRMFLKRNQTPWSGYNEFAEQSLSARAASINLMSGMT